MNQNRPLDESKPPFGKIKTALWENLFAALFLKKPPFGVGTTVYLPPDKSKKAESKFFFTAHLYTCDKESFFMCNILHFVNYYCTNVQFLLLLFPFCNLRVVY
jgi:hypothetical protein